MVLHLSAKIILGTVGGILFGLGIKEIIFTYLPAELQGPIVITILGFGTLLVAAKLS